MSFMMLVVAVFTSAAAIVPVNVEEKNNALEFSYHNPDKNSCTLIPLSPFPYERPTFFCASNTTESFIVHKSELTKIDSELQSTICGSTGYNSALQQELEDTAFDIIEWEGK